MQKEIAELVRRKRLSVRSLEAMLKHMPTPVWLEIQSNVGEASVRIPHGFMKAMGFKTGQRIFMYARGRKLILEDVAKSTSPSKA